MTYTLPPTSAATDASPSRRPRPPRALLAAFLAMIVGAAGLASTASPASAHPGGHRFGVALRCAGGIGETGDPVARCRWRDASLPDAASYDLVRGDGGGRSVMATFDDLSAGGFVDTGVAFGTRYAYVIVARDVDGTAIGRSRVAAVGVRRPRVEILPLDCRADDAASVRCNWGAAATADVQIYQLWRKVPGAPRVLVATVDDATSADDTIPDGIHRARYVVLGRDADGAVTARSRPEPLGVA